MSELPLPGAATAPPDAFAITDPLPLPGQTVLLEASAGTGKTWTISALVARYVAEGRATLDELLVVTFTRAASQELRERVRAHLLQAQRALLDPASVAQPDELVAHLLHGDHGVPREQMLARLTEALAGFDAATIATIHQFCQLVLGSLGVAGDTDSEAVLVDDLEQLTGEVVDDLYLARFADLEQPPWSHAEALAIARTVVDDPRARIEPSAALTEAPDTPAAARVSFAQAVLEEIDRRKRRLGVLSYDDLLGQLADALADDDSPARTRMRQRWHVVLIDEFQDTDPVQWQVFRRAFGEHEGSTLVLIGDPKQAIYAFRGGDVVTYLEAAATADRVRTLAVNWRADQPLLDAVMTLLEGAALGDERILVHPVRADHQGSRIDGAGPPLRLRHAGLAELGVGPRARPKVARWREHVLADAAADIARLLISGATLDGRPVEPRDVAVLAARRDELLAMQEALHALGVPAVVGVGGSVFHTPAADEWLVLLEALEQPHRHSRVRAAALTSFVGLTAAELDAGGDALTDDLAERMRALADLYATRGLAAVLEAAVADGLTERVLARVGGQRLLTDLRHVGEALHRVFVSDRLGVVGLLGWLREQVADDKVEVGSERTRRLDSDAAAVQLATIHASKGLEYPIVYLPTLWNRFLREPSVPLFHDDAGHRCRDVGARSPWLSEHLARHAREDAGESLRLLYVALTRARSQVVLSYAPAGLNTPASPLHRMLFGRRPGWAAVPDEQALPDPERLVQILGHWHEAGGPAPEPAVISPPEGTVLPPSSEPLAARRFTRRVDTGWRRTSYSSLSRAATVAAPATAGPLSEPEVDPPEAAADLALEGAALEPAGPPPPDLAAVPSPMADLPVGADFGSLVHEVLELADPAAPDWHAELRDIVADRQAWWGVSVDPEALADALVTVCDTPLGALADERTLRSIPRADRLPELDFELPLGGGDAARDAATEVVLGDLAPLLRRHLPEGDPLLAYAGTLEADPGLAEQPLRGYLTGSIDVVLRVGEGASQRFVTVDYKTNWLGEVGAELTSREYRPAVLAEAMGHSDYPLQALLYTAVLHRFLRWRLPGYDPAVHLGGVLYLYLRGLCGPDTPRVDGVPCGVFAWRPPVALVLALSDLLDGRTEQGGAP